MQHLYLLAFYLLALVNHAHAQAGVRLSGQVLDEQQRPVEFAPVLLVGSPDTATVIQAVATDVQGQFALEGVKPGPYRVRVQALGYRPVISPTLTVGTEPLAVGVLTAATESKLLSEVVVQGEKPVVERSLGKVTLNVTNSFFKTAPSALDVLRRAPGVRVDPLGAILLSGNVAPVVYVEGRQLPLTADELQNLATEDIEQVEIISNASARYDGDTRAVINIRLKQDKTLGLQGSAYAGGTLNRRYGGYEMGSSGTFKTRHWVLYGQLGYFERNQYLEGSGRRIVRDAARQRTFDNTLFQRFRRWPLSYQFAADYVLSAKQTVGVLVRGLDSRQRTSTAGTTFLATTDASGRLVEDYQLPGSTLARARPGNVVVDVSYRAKLGPQGDELLAYLDYATYRNEEAQDVRTTFASPNQNPLRFPALLLGDLSSSTRIRSLRTDYSHALGEVKLSVGAKFVRTSTDNALLYDTLAGAGLRVRDFSRSNQFQYDERIGAGYGGLTGTWGKNTVDAALRLEYTRSVGNSLTLDSQTTRAYYRWLPSLQLQHKFDERHSVALTFSRKLQRPSFSALNPFRLYVGPYQYNEGNPFLLPAIRLNTEVRVVVKDLALTATYQRGRDVPAQLPIQDERSGVIRYTWANQDLTELLSFEATAPVKVTAWWKMQNTLTAYHFRTASAFAGSRFDNRAWTVQFDGQQVFSLPHKATLEVNYEYSGPGASQIYRTRSSGTVGLSLQKPVLKGKATVLLTASDVFNTYRESFYGRYNGIDVSTLQLRDTQRLSARFTYRFGQSTFSRKSSTTGSAEEEGRAR
ncbi:MAG TPA: outer membrane beta-barrel protein [Hymenobacter sp.]|jgi:hypothetical protein|uniref:outer membrane beta-barrel protein n=1 Tax=Hymenobacter sp. TaxID=1898978 RepID=UPI002ED7C39D